MDLTWLRPHPDDVTFLDRNGIRITGSWFTVDGRRYAVPDLFEVWTVTGPRHPFAYRAFAAAGLVAVVAAVASPRLDSATAWLGVAIAIAIPLTAGLIALRAQPRPLSLWADYRGRAERLLESTDHVWFHQVCRALNRARAFNGH
ncbi:MAG: DUF6232 family protein [Micromonosporaceae bacterium]